MAKPLSRPKRWAEAVGNAIEALEILKGIQEEYQEWYDRLPDGLQQSPVGEKLDTIINIDLDGALTAVQEAEGADLPQGFGRD